MRGFVSYRAALAAVASLALAGSVQAAVIDLNPIADASAYEAAPDTNDGATETSLYWRGGSGSSQIAFIRFQLPVDFGTATSASIKIHPSSAANQWMGVFGIPYANDTWTETGLTWNTKPAFNGNDQVGNPDEMGVMLGSSATDGAGYQTFPNGTGLSPGDVVTFGNNLVAFLNNAPGSTISFAFNSVYGSTGNGVFDSSEGTNQPILHLEYDPAPVPEPASIALMGLAACGLMARRRRA